MSDTENPKTVEVIPTTIAVENGNLSQDKQNDVTAESTSPPSEINTETSESTAIPETPPDAPPANNHKSNRNTRGSNRRNNRSNRGRRRGGGGNHQNSNGRRFLTVASTSQVKMVAGSIAHTSRATEPPILSAVGPASVNQAIKAIAVARTYLQDDKIELYVEVVRPPGHSDIKDLIQFSLYKCPARESHDSANITYTDLKSAGSTGTGQLAGAIAKSVRDGSRVRIKAIGADSIFRAVDAITFARNYLQPDGLDVRFQPKFIKVTFEDGTNGNAMQLELFAQQV